MATAADPLGDLGEGECQQRQRFSTVGVGDTRATSSSASSIKPAASSRSRTVDTVQFRLTCRAAAASSRTQRFPQCHRRLCGISSELGVLRGPQQPPRRATSARANLLRWARH
ncbi:MAG: hypothetical protein ACRD1G_15845 [Acidimicrobiales bacterium]